MSWIGSRTGSLGVTPELLGSFDRPGVGLGNAINLSYKCSQSM